tara:strand:- start:323 stop:517 length:195 start_codon:yes stop_codon:yes gene_type:complete
MRVVYKNLWVSKVSSVSNKMDKGKNANSITVKITKEDTKLTLAETIEELGFIPSVNENDDNKAA